MVRVDLHSHSVASDGVFSPTEMVRRASKRGVELYALTDHDTLEGVHEAMEEAAALQLSYVPALELSTQCEGETVHLLGYFRDQSFTHPELLHYLSVMKEARRVRARAITEGLKKHFSIVLDSDALLSKNGGSIARPHIAKAIVSEGYAKSFDEAFHSFLGAGSPAYIPTTKMSTAEGVAFLQQYGCFISLAHPVLLKRVPVERVLCSGIHAIEARYPHQTEEQTLQLLSLAHDRGLLVTVGSDDHGMVDDTVHGILGDYYLPCDEYEKLINALSPSA